MTSPVAPAPATDVAQSDSTVTCCENLTTAAAGGSPTRPECFKLFNLTLYLFSLMIRGMTKRQSESGIITTNLTPHRLRIANRSTNIYS